MIVALPSSLPKLSSFVFVLAPPLTFFVTHFTLFLGNPNSPGTPMVLFPIPGQQFTITWDQPSLNMSGPVDAYFVNISGRNDLCGNVDTLQRVNNRSYTCSGWRMSIGQKYTFTVQAANCGGTQRGPTGDPVTVCLQGM